MNSDKIPDTWALTLMREGSGWTGMATKCEGVRKVSVNTFNDPRPTIDEALSLIEERIKQ